MPEWIIVYGEPQLPRYDRYTSLDEALVEWEHLKQLRRHVRENRRTMSHPRQHDFLAMVIDDREYQACEKK